MAGTLLNYVQAMVQNNAITKKERNELVALIQKSFTDGYDELIKKLISLSKIMVFMNNIPQLMIDEINKTTRKEELDC